MNLEGFLVPCPRKKNISRFIPRTVSSPTMGFGQISSAKHVFPPRKQALSPTRK